MSSCDGLDTMSQLYCIDNCYAQGIAALFQTKEKQLSGEQKLLELGRIQGLLNQEHKQCLYSCEDQRGNERCQNNCNYFFERKQQLTQQYQSQVLRQEQDQQNRVEDDTQSISFFSKPDHNQAYHQLDFSITHYQEEEKKYQFETNERLLNLVANDVYLGYEICITNCDVQLSGCYQRCADLKSREIQMNPIYQSLFNKDTMYDPKIEDFLFSSENIFEDFTGYESDQQKLIRKMEVSTLVNLFALEKYSRATFDPLYLADSTDWDQYKHCKKHCKSNDLNCVPKCLGNFSKSVFNQASQSLNPKDCIVLSQYSLLSDQLDYGRDTSDYVLYQIKSKLSLLSEVEDNAAISYELQIKDLNAIDKCYRKVNNYLEEAECVQMLNQYYQNYDSSQAINSLQSFSEFQQQVGDFDSLLNCYNKARTLNEMQQCNIQHSLYISMYQGRCIQSLYTKDINEKVVEKLQNFLECLYNSNSEEKVQECIEMFEDAANLTMLDLMQFNKGVNQESLLSLHLEHNESPGLKIIETYVGSYAQLKYRPSKALSLIGSENYDEAKIDQLLDKEMSRRDEIFSLKVEQLRDKAIEEFNNTNEYEWFAKAAGQYSENTICSAECMESCFKSEDLPISVIMNDCVLQKCQCQNSNITAMSLSDLQIDVVPFDDYLINSRNSKLLLEQASDYYSITQDVDFDCAYQCLSSQEIIYRAKEICMQKACKVHLNLFRTEENISLQQQKCDPDCANECFSLVFQSARRNCVLGCGCMYGLNLAQNKPLSKKKPQDIKMPNSLYVNIFISILILAFLGGLFITIRRAKNQIFISQMEEKHQARRQKIRQMRDYDQDEKTFDVTERYEKVI
ncbi:UNKNOWN [Stylonychia lemnae]|uniref:Transmembrane protein n=1 Tax=Stylonychia lemnae TaxID=5949 RepID=A0A078A6I9_STYLE|nr:UNKNOWN [Stylonychia lemnae]|eukprot:CDW76344.1 UNKNOWN [Stylonychia lemnae]